MLCVPPRCAEAEADSSNPQGVPAGTELIPSSQGSPISNPAALMQPLPQIYNPDGPGAPDEICGSANTTPASTTVTRASCWFLIFTAITVCPLTVPCGLDT